jgi:hypothetical protein
MSLTDLAPQTTDDRSDAEPGATIDLSAARPGPGRPQFTITEAATACAVSRKTITRKLADLAEHGAAKDSDGVWRIPVEALLAVGLHPGRSVPDYREPQGRPREATVAPSRPAPSEAAAAGAPQRDDVVTVPRDRWDDLRIRLARAEAEAAERALALADARLALRALTAGPTAGTSPAAVASAQAGAASLPAATPTASPLPPTAAPTVVPAEAVDPLAQARSRAAQTGSSVSADGVTRRRRWWQSQKG